MEGLQMATMEELCTEIKSRFPACVILWLDDDGEYERYKADWKGSYAAIGLMTDAKRSILKHVGT